MISPSVVQLVSLCAAHGVGHAILSPGSRCAPLTLAFARHPKIHTRTISDERSAAFIALGMAQQLQKPVVLVCTSGSACLNYYPAIAEAYFQQIPLLVLTADRPPEWIDQYDGQTIFQENVFGKHVKGSFSLPTESSSPETSWHARRVTNEAVQLTQSFPKGPVHINIPLREPFYPAQNEVLDFDESGFVKLSTAQVSLSTDTRKKITDILPQYRRILVLCGQQRPNPKIQSLLDSLAKKNKLVVLSDTISNCQSDETICLHDHWLANENIHTDLQPDLILSFGMSIISKSLKLFLRKSQADHWHVQPDGKAKDTFRRLSRILSSDVEAFLDWFAGVCPSSDPDFITNWRSLESQVKRKLPEILQAADFGEYPAMSEVLKRIPPFSKVHVANSMAVRYLNFLGKRSQEVICNRGTSGIDGSNSTAVGCTFTTKEPVTLLTGDMAFFYDRNAFWHNYSMPNLRIILFNNHAGGIFRLIEGPSKQPELAEYFETKQALNGRGLAKEFDFDYQAARSREELVKALDTFYTPSIKPRLIEIESQSSENASILATVKEQMLGYLSED